MLLLLAICAQRRGAGVEQMLAPNFASAFRFAIEQRTHHICVFGEGLPSARIPTLGCASVCLGNR